MANYFDIIGNNDKIDATSVSLKRSNTVNDVMQYFKNNSDNFKL